MRRNATEISVFTPVFTACSEKKQTNQELIEVWREEEKMVSIRQLSQHVDGGVCTNLRGLQVTLVTSQRADFSMFELEMLSEKQSSQT